MDEKENMTDEQRFDADLEAVDIVIESAAAAIDAGEYRTALEGFREALRMARRFFGDNLELENLGDAINDIGELLGD